MELGQILTILAVGIALAVQRRSDMKLIDRRFDDINKRFDESNRRIDKRFDDVNKRFDDRRFDDINKRFDESNRRIDKRFDDVNKRFDETKRTSASMPSSVGSGRTARRSAPKLST